MSVQSASRFFSWLTNFPRSCSLGQGYSQEESERLDIQHQFTLDAFDGSTLSDLAKQAAKEGRIKTILDVATGTGSWAVDALKEVRSLSPPDVGEITVVGLDIAANEEWPRHTGVQFEQADIFDLDQLKAIRDRYTGGAGFDLVHVRYVQVVVPAEHWPSTAQTFVSLVKPNCVLQHEEVDFGLMARNNIGPVATLMGYFASPAHTQTGKLPEVGHQLAEWYTRAGLFPVHDFVTANLGPASGPKYGVSEDKMKRSGAYQDYMANYLPSLWLKAGAPRMGLSERDAQEAFRDFQGAWMHFRATLDGTDFTYIRRISGTKSVFAVSRF